MILFIKKLILIILLKTHFYNFNQEVPTREKRLWKEGLFTGLIANEDFNKMIFLQILFLKKYSTQFY